MFGISSTIIKQLREDYPIGTRVELIKMDDVQAPPIGTYGTVRGVDDIGSIMVDWDNGSSLNVAYGEDFVKKLSICPKCKKTFNGRPALSRVDNKTSICPECGLMEALDALGASDSMKNEVLAAIKDQ